MTNPENINIVNEEVIDAATKAVEAIPVKPNGKFSVIAGVVFIGGAIITGVALAINNKKNKKKAAEEPAAVEAEVVDNVQVAKDDFEE